MARAVSTDDLLAEVPGHRRRRRRPRRRALVRTRPVWPARRSAATRRLRLTRLTTEGFASFAGRDNPVVGSMQRRLLVSGSADLARDQRKAYLDAVSRQIDHAASAVVAPSGNVTPRPATGGSRLNISTRTSTTSPSACASRATS